MFTKKSELESFVELRLFEEGCGPLLASRLAHEVGEHAQEIYCYGWTPSKSPGETETYVPAERRGTGHPLYGQP